jgi:hypothetical protein
MNLKEPVSGRQFAKMVGQSEGAVRKAVERQSILKGKTADGKFIPEVASLEWGKPILEEFLKPKKTSPQPPIKKTVKPSIPKFKKEAETMEEIVDEIMHEKLPSANADDLDDDTVSEDLDDKILKPEAERVTAVLKAKILQITYQEKKGQLVPIEKVNTVNFSYGQEIRNAIEGMPNRSLDKIRAAKTRHEAKRIYELEIYNTLNLLADIQERKM